MTGVVETQTATPVETGSKSRSTMEIHHRLNFDVSDSAVAPPPPLRKRRRRVAAVVQSSNDELPNGEKRLKTPECPRFGVTSVCGRRRDMEDAVAIRPSFCGRDSDVPGGLHFFGVFDGHGCSHVSNGRENSKKIKKNLLLSWI